MNSKGFTLIELLIALAIAAVITGTVYFTLQSALDGWGHAKDELALQKVLLETLGRVTSGGPRSHGLRAALEVTAAGPAKIEFVPPWTDDTHTAADESFVYTLNRRIKPGAAPPIGEVFLPDADTWEPVTVRLTEIHKEASLRGVQLGGKVPAGSALRFIYHADPGHHPDLVNTLWWDDETKQVFARGEGGIENISENPFGVEITGFQLKYLDRTNGLVRDRGWVGVEDLETVSGVEIVIEASLGKVKKSLVDFVSLRNAPAHSGRFSLRKGMRLAVPDSHGIHTLLLTNLTGIRGGDELELEAIPRRGARWRVKVVFENVGSQGPKVKKVSVEYPPSKTLFTDYPGTSAAAGVNLLILGSNGLYDYDDDQQTEDTVLLEGEVTLKVNKMDIGGAGLFVRP